MAKDVINIEVLDDGILKVTTDKISAPNHISAEALLRDIKSDAGGKSTYKHTHGTKHAHSHVHGEEHQHQ